MSPENGTEVPSLRPTLVAGNATTAEWAFYQFQVARNPGFDGLVAASGLVPADSDGRASWQVPAALERVEYFWRAHAEVGDTVGPLSDTASFVVNPNATPPPPPPPPPITEIVDPLTDGTSVGQVSGGRFSADGWTVTSQKDFIRYKLTTVPAGFVEWENTGLTAENRSSDQFMLLGMWDPSKGRYRTNPFRVHIQKLDTTQSPPFVRLRWITNGEEHDGGFDFLAWNPDNVYRWRLEWGPEGNTNVVRLLLDDQTVIRINYTEPYAPDVLYVELGVEERQESVVGATYRNVRIGPR